MHPGGGGHLGGGAGCRTTAGGGGVGCSQGGGIVWGLRRVAQWFSEVPGPPAASPEQRECRSLGPAPQSQTLRGSQDVQCGPSGPSKVTVPGSGWTGCRGDRSSTGCKGGTGWGMDWDRSPGILCHPVSSSPRWWPVSEGAVGRRPLPACPLGPCGGCGGRGLRRLGLHPSTHSPRGPDCPAGPESLPQNQPS